MMRIRPRLGGSISTAPSADIAFLLLIFFLVTATIDVDTGISMTLPPPLDGPPPEVHERNVLSVLINNRGDLLVEGRPADLESLRSHVKRHVLNCESFDCSPAYAASPEKAIVSIKSGRATPYRHYVEVLDEVWMAYFEMRDAEARASGFADYVEYASSLEGRPDEIRKKIKAQISVAEPDR